MPVLTVDGVELRPMWSLDFGKTSPSISKTSVDVLGLLMDTP